VLKIAGFLVKTFESAINGVIDVVNFAIRQANRLNPFGDVMDEIGKVSISSSFGAAPTAPSRGPAIDVSGVTDSFDRFNAGVNTLPNIPTVTAPTVTTPSGGGGGGGGGGGRAAPVLGANSRGGGTPFGDFVIQPLNPDEVLRFLGGANAAPTVVNVNVTTTTTDGEFPNKIVEALQTYNLVSGPLDVQIAV
jgi:hypothetical protein